MRSSFLGRETKSNDDRLVFGDNSLAAALYGEGEKSLRLIEKLVGAELHARGNEIRIA